MKILISIFIREYRLLLRCPIPLFNSLLFFIIVIFLFCLMLDTESKQLTQIAPSFIWITVLLSILLYIERFFSIDFANGSLEQWILSPYPLTLLSLIKVLANWIFFIFNLSFFLPFLIIMLNLPIHSLLYLLISLLLGTLILILIGAIGVVLTLGIKQGGLLFPILVLPLYIPVLILGTVSLKASLQGESIYIYILLLASLTIFTLTFSPFAIAAGLKISISEE